jgi:hypothetical protein
MTLTPTSFNKNRYDLLTANPANPAVGTPLTWPVPTGTVVQVVSVTFTLVTSATAGNRLPLVYVTTGGAVNAPYSPAAVKQIAGQTRTYFFTIGLAPLDYGTDFLWVFQPLGCCYQMKTGHSLLINANGLDALDQISNVGIRYFSWLEE